jgi:hypothetical protein
VHNIYGLAVGNEENGFVNSNLLTSYLANLEQGKQLGIQTMEKLLFEGREHVTKADWIEVFMD